MKITESNVIDVLKNLIDDSESLLSTEETKNALIDKIKSILNALETNKEIDDNMLNTEPALDEEPKNDLFKFDFEFNDDGSIKPSDKTIEIPSDETDGDVDLDKYDEIIDKLEEEIPAGAMASGPYVKASLDTPSDKNAIFVPARKSKKKTKLVKRKSLED